MDNKPSTQIPPSPSEKSESDSPQAKSESSNSPPPTKAESKITTTVLVHKSVDTIGHTRQEIQRQVHGRMKEAGAEYSWTEMIKVDGEFYHNIEGSTETLF